MTTYTHRPYADAADLRAMIDLTTQRPSTHITAFPSMIDLQEMLGTAVYRDHTHLWHEQRGQLAGFAILDVDEDAANLIFDVAAAAQGQVGTGMLDWATAVLQPAAQASPIPMTLDISARDDDAWRSAWLLAHGFTQQAGGSVIMTRSLDGDIPLAQLPAGFAVRPLAGAGEVDAWIALHRAAWGTENMTTTYRLSMMGTPDYDPALDLVAVAANGELAAYCMCAIIYAENELSGRQVGYTDPIATHPRWQRQGLARALMLHGLRLLREHGMTVAQLSTSLENVAMQATAVAVGFQVTSRAFTFSRAVAG
ncbi:MAG: GNAT family N-acetyltransferase [Anaerolinea sp.]|nr:GNAT family N-acetyltransferase [Anaerolinea sp.]